MTIRVKKVNAFSDSINGGNPAGVVLNSPDLTDNQMKDISRKLNVSETAFVFPSETADYKLRFFSPEVEVDLCGHATIATFYSIATDKKIPENKMISYCQETNVGILPIDIYFKDNELIDRVMMTQQTSKIKDIYLDISLIADSLNIEVEEIDNTFPKQIVSTGLFTLPICINSFDILKNIKPDYSKIKKICRKYNFGSYHLFTFDTIESDSVYHARNFPPLYGINEDPVTGTANGAVCSYLFKNKIINKNHMKCEQGDIMGRPGRVFVDIKNDIIQVGGKAKIVEELEFD